ncbi:unnamed protein product [Cuscuta epithymum]|uniref:NAC domain-containing protein n=2 Tax=Cuscuta epithymum TaxID=186058 RepID=A0AAV0DAE4_9ASTE|nr:unnamed protein product [Cuscuta epithymum]
MMEDGDISGANENEDVELGGSSNSEQEISNSDGNNGKAPEICLATASSMFPGFRFSPTDQELISYYLKKKLEGIDSCVELISEVEIWRHEPWDLPAKSVVQSDNEWFFFSPRGRKYPNGSQSKRATESGYWKATGKNRNVKSGPNVIGTKRTLVFHTGRAPEGQRTEWIMHEYCSDEKQPQDSMVVCRLRKNKEFHLNDTPRILKDHSAADNINNKTYCELQHAGSVTEVTEPSTGGSCSNPCSSTFNFQSLKQIDYGFDYDQTYEILSSHNLKDYDNEDDCFTDILRDDIIKLDDSSLSTPLDSLSVITNKNLGPDKQHAQGFEPRVLPPQGTANRRLRLRREKVSFLEASYQVKNMKTHAEEISIPDKEQSPRCGVVRQRLKNLFIYALIVVTLILLFLLLSSLEGSHLVKWFGDHL